MAHAFIQLIMTPAAQIFNDESNELHIRIFLRSRNRFQLILFGIRVIKSNWKM